MSCFSVEILDSNIKTLEIETCIGGEASNIEIINYDNNILVIEQCATLLPPSGTYAYFEHNHGNISSSGTIGSISGLLIITGNSGLLTAISGINSSYITNFNSSVTGILPPLSNIVYTTGNQLIDGYKTFDKPINLVIGPYTVSINAPFNPLQDNIEYYLPSVTTIGQDVVFLASTSNKISDFKSCSSSELKAKITDETGSGALVFNSSPVFSGIPLVPTAPSGTNSQQIASTAFVHTAILNSVGSSGVDNKVSKSGDIMTGTLTAPTGKFTYSVTVNDIPVSLSGHSHLSSDISNFDSSVSGLIPVKSIVGSGYIMMTHTSGNYSIFITGLQPSGNYAISGHQHLWNNITQTFPDIPDFGSGVAAYVDTLMLGNSGVQLVFNSGANTLTIALSGEALAQHQISSSGLIARIGANSYVARTLQSGTNIVITNNNGISGNPTIALNPYLNISGITVNGNGTFYGDLAVSGILTFNGGSLSTGNFVSVTDINQYVSGVKTFHEINIEDTNIQLMNDDGNFRIDIQNSNILTLSSESLNIYGSIYSNSIPVSVSGHTHVASEITDFNNTVSGLLPVKSIAGSGYIKVSSTTGNYTISVSGLQPSGNYSLVGHTHSANEITDFNSSVSGLLPTISNSGNNKLLTSTGSSFGINAEDNLTFDGSLLTVNGSGVFTSGIIVSGVSEIGGYSTHLYSDGDFISVRYFNGVNTNFIWTTDEGLFRDVNNEKSINYIERILYGTGIYHNPVLCWGHDSSVGIKNEFPDYTLDVYGSGNFSSGLYVNHVPVSLSGHTHLSVDIIDFGPTVSGLLPVKNILAGTGIGIINSDGIFTISATGMQTSGDYVPFYSGSYGDGKILISSGNYLIPNTLTAGNGINISAGSGNIIIATTGLPSNFCSGVKDCVNTQLVAGNYIALVYDSGNNQLTVSSTGLQPSGNYSVVGHTHVSSDITDFNSSVSGLLPVKNILGGTDISVSNSSGIYTINSIATDVDMARSLVTTVFNETGSTLTKMTAVYISGGHGDMPTVSKAIATSDMTSAGTYGLVYSDINNMEIGQVIVFGALSGVNTDPAHGGISGAVNGSILYLSPTVSGGITTTKPYAPQHVVTLGTVVRVHQNAGVIEVRIQNGFELDELHNVAITGATNGQFLQYNAGSGLWMPTSSGNFTSLNLNNSGVSVIGHTHTSSDITNFDSSVSGLLPTISNSGDNRILTSTGSTVGINAESNLTFDGSLLSITGSGNFSNGLSVNNNIVWHSGNLSNPISGSLIRTANSIPVFNSTNSITNSKIDDLPFSTVFNNDIIISYGQYDGYDYGLMEYDSNQVIAVKYQPGITPYFIYGGGTPDNGNMTINGDNGNVGIGTSTPSYKLDVNGNANVSGTLTFKDFTENVVAIGNSSTSQTLSLTNGTVQTCTLTGNCVFTMPTTTAGKSFILFLNTGAGSFTASFTGVRWTGNTAPTITTTASKVDIVTFISDGSFWYGSYSQNYG